MITKIDESQLKAMLDVVRRYRRPVEIDWTNRTVCVLSPPYDTGKRYRSDGQPIVAQDILCNVR